MVLILLCLAVYVPGLASIPPVDRDECRFAQSSRQMFEAAALPPQRRDLRVDEAGRPAGLHAGGWAIPMYAHAPRLNKPPLVYWVQVGSAWVFTGGDPSRDAMWMYRLPSALAALLSVLVTWRLGVRLFDPRAAWLGAALLAVSPMVVWDAHQARADQLLLLSVVVAQYALARVWLAAHRRSVHADPAAPARGHPAHTPAGWWWPAVFWLALSAGLLTKGPIGLMIAALTTAALSLAGGSWRWTLALRPWLGAALVLAALTPWLWAIHHRFGLGWYAGVVWQELFLRAARGSREGHLAPPGTHLVLLVVLFWPGCLLTLWSLARAFRVGWVAPREDAAAPTGAAARGPAARARAWLRALRRRRPGRRGELFLLAWAVPSWIVFELALAKLPHYTMPLYPALALLSARAVFAAQGRLRPAAPGTWLWAGIGLLASAGLVTAGVVLIVGAMSGAPASGVLTGTLLLAGGLLGCLFMGAALQALRAGAFVAAQGLSLPAAVAALSAALVGVAPEIVPGARTARLFEHALQVPGLLDRPLATLDHEDSVLFWSRGRALRIAHDQVPAFTLAHPDGVLIERTLWEARDLVAPGWKPFLEPGTPPGRAPTTPWGLVVGPWVELPAPAWPPSHQGLPGLPAEAPDAPPARSPGGGPTR
jgi:4-amino-4-deoxy-L-arabinose transferase-like glycosyltransferase